MTLRLPSAQDATPEDRAAIFAAAMEMAQSNEARPATATLTDVELVEVGSWDACTPDGLPFEVTAEGIASAIAAIEIGDARPPTIKLGHDSILNDGAPAFGKGINLRTSDEAMKLRSDLAGMPVWLADIAPSAYPRRSIEAIQNYTSDTGRFYPMIVTAVALLGTAYPAVETIEDIRACWAETAPPLIPVTTTAGRAIAARRTGGPAVPEPKKVAARASDDQVWTAFYAQMSWDYWIRELYVDPLEVIATNDATGELERVPYEIAADGTITFGDPVPVQVEYIDRPVAANASAKTPRLAPGAGAKTFATRTEYRKTVATTTPEGADQEEDSMADIDPKTLCAILGLDPGAPQEEIDAAIEAKANEAADLGTQADADADAEVPTPTIPEGFTLVPTEEHQRNSDFVETQLANQLETALASAVTEKRILPANKASLRTQAGISAAERSRVIELCTGDAEAVKAGRAIAAGTVGPLKAAGETGRGPADAGSNDDSKARIAARVAHLSGNKTTKSEGR
jgi:hypothetical protein